jgi:hypothetical protein
MTQAEINRAVAAVTGESPVKICRLGFGLADPLDVNFDPEPSDVAPQWLDWDHIHRMQPVRPFRRRRRPVCE